jgi:putative membrane protein
MQSNTTGTNEDKTKSQNKNFSSVQTSMENTQNTENPDKDFAMKAAQGGMMEVKLGELAQSKAKTTEGKNFGKHMVDDHSKANDELKAIAQRKNISLSTSLDEETQKKYDEFTKKNADDFDKDYIDFMVKDHKEDISHFEKEASNGQDADLKNWASQKLPVLKHHLEMAENAQSAFQRSKKSL